MKQEISSDSTFGAGRYDGLWLGYRPLAASALGDRLAGSALAVHVAGHDEVAQSARNELRRGLSALLDTPVTATADPDGARIVAGSADTAVPIPGVLGDPTSWPEEAFAMWSSDANAGDRIYLVGGSSQGLLYGVFALLREWQMGHWPEMQPALHAPRIAQRVLNHWDNWTPSATHGSVERGYAGDTLWKWDELPEKIDSRYADYARACASVGINGAVLNNVNAQVDFIRTENLPKVAALAGVLRRWGMRVYVAVRYDSPIVLGGLATADPEDPGVVEWWAGKIDELYGHIPDCGGLQVKGDSEGQPGPLCYGRNHAVGANMLARLLLPYGGMVHWRTFVYRIPGLSDDRLKNAYEVFQPLDGAFDENVMLQTKFGPLDFQVREPPSPLFGRMPRSNLGMEVQLAQEYTGTDKTYCWLAPQWREVLDFDTQALGTGSTIARVVDGTLFQRPHSLIAGVANTGDGPQWTGHDLAQANWYAFGRLAWDPGLTLDQIAQEWTRLTFGADPLVGRTIPDLLLRSRAVFEKYTSPLGLGLMVERAVRRMAPAPAAREPWHRADTHGVGYDRTRSGSGFVDQYHAAVSDQFNDLATCPESLLLWFHHVPYSWCLKSGRPLIEALCDAYHEGVAEVESMVAQWAGLAGHIDPPCHARVQVRFQEQLAWARIWRDTCTRYFLTKG